MSIGNKIEQQIEIEQDWLGKFLIKSTCWICDAKIVCSKKICSWRNLKNNKMKKTRPYSDWFQDYYKNLSLNPGFRFNGGKKRMLRLLSHLKLKPPKINRRKNIEDMWCYDIY